MRASWCRRRATRTSRSSRRCSSTRTSSSATRARSCSTLSSGDRPAVCVLYDEGAPAGRVVGGEERRRRALPGARGVRRASIAPSASRRSSPGSSARSSSRTELAEARRRAVEQVVGTVDGRAAERVVDAAPRSSGSPWDEARDDAPRARRGGRRRRADRVPSPCGRRLRRRDRQRARATGRRRSSSGTSAPASCGSSASRLTTCARTSGSRGWRGSRRPTTAPTG